MYTFSHMHTHVYLQPYAHMYTYSHLHTHLHLQSYAHMYTYSPIHTCVHLQLYAYMYTYRHMHTHVYLQPYAKQWTLTDICKTMDTYRHMQDNVHLQTYAHMYTYRHMHTCILIAICICAHKMLICGTDKNMTLVLFMPYTLNSLRQIFLPVLGRISSGETPPTWRSTVKNSLSVVGRKIKSQP